MTSVFETVYSTSQVDSWLQRIGLPRDFRPRHQAGLDLEDLTKLQQATLATVPFEDVEIHYSKHHTITLDPQGLYNKIVVKRQGGYCMQGNTLFEHMIRALGYDVYTTGARVRPRTNGIPDGPYKGWVHQVCIIRTVDGQQYVVDVAFGGDCPLSPLLLAENHLVPNIGTRRTRLIKKAVGRDPRFLSWVHQIQFDEGAEWLDVYCFTESEFLPQDYQVMSYYTSTNAASWLTVKIVGIRMIMEDGKIIGKYTIDHGTVKRNIRGDHEVIIECKTEKERVDALAKYFGLVLTDEEQEAIKGFPGEIKS